MDHTALPANYTMTAYIYVSIRQMAPTEGGRLHPIAPVQSLSKRRDG